MKVGTDLQNLNTQTYNFRFYEGQNLLNCTQNCRIQTSNTSREFTLLAK